MAPEAPPAKPPALPPPGSRHTVVVDGLDDEGRGRALLFPDEGEEARVDVAVRGAFPGDRVLFVVERLFPARRLAVGRAVELLEEGPARVARACVHEAPTVCCPLDGLEPSAQIALKRERVLQALRDQGLAHLEPLVAEVRLPPSPTGRRQKVKLVAGGGIGRLRLGLYAPWSRVLVPGHACAYERPELARAAEAVIAALDEVRVPPASVAPEGLRAVILRSFEEGVGAVLVAGAPLPDAAWRRACALVDDGRLASLAERVDRSESGSVVGGAVTRQRGPRALSPLEGGEPTSVDAFCQPDADLARAMYADVAAWLAGGEEARDDEARAEEARDEEDRGEAARGEPRFFVDAYAGTGGFSRALLAHGVYDIVAVERAEPSLPALRALGVEAIGASVEDAVAGLAARGRPAGVVADPPKKGLVEAALPLASLGAPRFALVSCDPDAMARDVATLSNAGYRVARIEPVDLFSGAPEVEVVTFLVRG